MAREQPFAFIALAVSIGIALCAAVALGSQMRRAEMAQTALAELRGTAVLKRSPDVAAHLLPAVPELPSFRSSELVTVLNQTAAESDLVLNEVTYSLDDNTNQPYLRYRINMTLHASYPLIRRLAEQLSAKVPHLTLDTIDCSRKDVVAAELSCEMGMSGFFKKGVGG